MKVTFNINFHTVWGQKLCVVGSIPELGSWEPALAKEMSYKGDGNWQLELEVTSPVKDIEYRFVLLIWPFIPQHLLKVCLHIRVIRMSGW